MRHHGLALWVGVFILASAAIAQAQSAGSVQGFGGLSLGVGDAVTSNVGGTLTVQLTPHVHVVGEAGRLGNVLPPASSRLFSLADVGLNASALYGEGGVRFLATPHSRVTPYAEATAGVARLDVGIDGLGGLGNSLASAGLSLMGRTGPMAGVGGGVLMRTGPLVVDVGYRYKHLFPPEPLGTVLGLGQNLRSQQVRVGVGVRF